MSPDALARVDARRAAGDDAGALALAEAAVAAGSTQLALHFRLASLLLRAGRYRDADAATVRAAKLAPATPAELVELGKRLAYFNRGEVLRGVAAGRLKAPSWHAGAEADLAALLSMLGEQDIAFALIERAARRGVDPAILYNRSQLHLYAGRMDAAEADLRQALRLAPDMAKARWALSKLPGPRADPAAVAPLAQLAGAVAPTAPDAPYLLYALFNHLDALDRVDEAWSALARACAAKRRQLDYDPARSADLFAALGAVAPPPATTAPDRAPGTAPGEGDAPTPVFIVGMHRSGTTLLERMLGNHPDVREGGELYDFPAALRLALGRHFPGPTDAEVARRADQLDFAAVGREYLQRVGWRADGRGFLVDKLPSNFLNAAFIARALPGARLLHMRRGAMDTCFSNLKELFSNACPYSYDQVELADWYRGYRGLMAGWQAAAPGAVLEVEYEALARDPRGEGERVLAFCGLAWDAACLDVAGSARSVNTASSAQVREPIHTRGIGAWKRYEAWLGPLAARLAEP
jgi:tetratricopeptide (TPR) repeat protein